jgi:hypothetical protein
VRPDPFAQRDRGHLTWPGEPYGRSVEEVLLRAWLPPRRPPLALVLAGLHGKIAVCNLLRMTTKIPETLETMIERLVREHLAGQQLAARAAVERAFWLAAPGQRTAQRRQAKYRRRPPTEITQLAERVLEAVRACPG